MTKKITEQMATLSPVQWWSGFDASELSSSTKKQRKTKEVICWPFYSA